MNILIIIILSFFSLVEVTSAADTSEIDRVCKKSMAEVRSEFGTPFTVGEELIDSVLYVVWNYPDVGMKKLFGWEPQYEGCIIREREMPLSQKGIDTGVKVIKAKHPTWSMRACRSVFEKKIYIGMTRSQVVASWGEPNHINRTIGIQISSEQWIYGNELLYFEDGQLSTMQLSR